MSEQSGPFEVHGIRVNIANAPPVYAPGGPVALVFQLSDACDPEVLAQIETEASARGAVLLVVQCLVTESDNEATLLAGGFTYASSWYFGHLAKVSEAISSDGIRRATASDVPRILEIGETKREQYEKFSPVFWKKAPTPRDDFAPYVTLQVESAENIALVHEVDGEIRGYLIAQCRNLAEGYVDDYAVADENDGWRDVGTALLAEASRQAADRNVQTFAIVAGHADAPKRAAVEAPGFELRKNWLVKALTSQA